MNQYAEARAQSGDARWHDRPKVPEDGHDNASEKRAYMASRTSDPLPQAYLVPILKHEAEIDIGRYWRTILRHRVLIISMALLAAAVGALASFVAVPIYQVDALLAPVEDEQDAGGLSGLAGQLGGLSTLAGIAFSGSTRKDEAIATLRSRMFIEDFVKENNLLPVLFAEQWDAELGRWDVSEDDVPTLWDAYEYFKEEILYIGEDSSNGLVTLSIRWSDPDLAAKWAGALIRRVNNRLRQRVISEASDSLAYLNAELEKAKNVELRQALIRLIEAQINGVMLARIREEYAFRVLDPPSVPDMDGYIWPKPALVIALSLLGGMAISIFLAALLDAIRRGQRGGQ